ncbi:MAG: UxaA family hydrolase [Dehalococcoidia bacterium]
MAYQAVVHRREDSVAVAVAPLTSGEELEVHALEGGPPLKIRVLEAIPLGHKVALHEIPEGTEVIKYGEKIGRAVRTIPAGAHVHVHNLKSLKWG